MGGSEQEKHKTIGKIRNSGRRSNIVHQGHKHEHYCNYATYIIILIKINQLPFLSFISYNSPHPFYLYRLRIYKDIYNV